MSQLKNEHSSKQQDKNKESQANKRTGEKDQTDQEPKQIEQSNRSHSRAIKAAREQIGTPYDWGGGKSPEGFDAVDLFNIFPSKRVQLFHEL